MTFSANHLGPTVTLAVPPPPSPAPSAASFLVNDDKNGIRSTPQPRSPSAIDFITRDINRGTPGTINKKASKASIGRNKSTKSPGYYSEVFAAKDQGPSAPKAACVYVELKTNVMLENEFEFAKALSAMIAKRYNRDEETVCITLNHSAVIIMAGTFDGAYILTITSVSMISPSVNKRNSAVMTEWFSHNLGVPGNRGFIRFVDPDVSNYAIGGVTMLDLMEKEEKARTGLTERTELVREKSVVRSMSRQVSRKGADTPDSDKRPSTSCGRLAKKSVFNLFSRSQRASEGSEDDYRS